MVRLAVAADCSLVTESLDRYLQPVLRSSWRHHLLHWSARNLPIHEKKYRAHSLGQLHDGVRSVLGHAIPPFMAHARTLHPARVLFSMAIRIEIVFSSRSVFHRGRRNHRLSTTANLSEVRFGGWGKRLGDEIQSRQPDRALGNPDPVSIFCQFRNSQAARTAHGRASGFFETGKMDDPTCGIPVRCRDCSGDWPHAYV